MHATLTGAGFGGSANALSAVATFLLKDGCGMAAGLLFSYFFSRGFDDETRFWRLFADVINDVGLTLELAAPLFGPYFIVATSIANVAKALCGVAAGATRAAVSAHFALSGNVGEVQAKEGVQETFVTLAGMLGGYALVAALVKNQDEGAEDGANAPGSAHSSYLSSRAASWAAFLFLTLLHVVSNWLGMRILALRSLNRSRAYALRVAVQRAGADVQGCSTAQLLEAVPNPIAMRFLDPLVLPSPYAGKLERAFAGLACFRARTVNDAVQQHRLNARAEPCDFACGVSLQDALTVAEQCSVALASKGEEIEVEECALVLLRVKREGESGWRVMTLRYFLWQTSSHAGPGTLSTLSDSAHPKEVSMRRRRGSVTRQERSVANRLLRAQYVGESGSAIIDGPTDGVVLAWAPGRCGERGGARIGLCVPPVWTGELVAPAVRVACLQGVQPSTLLAAYYVACTILSHNNGWTAVHALPAVQDPPRFGLLHLVHAEAVLAERMLEGAAKKGWQTVDGVWLGDEGVRYRL